VDGFRYYRPAACCCLGLCAMGVGSCGPEAGALWYHLGLVPKQKVSAEYKLAKGPLLVLVEDNSGQMLATPRLRSLLARDLTRQLAQHNVNKNVISQHLVDRLRRTERRFEQIPPEQIGKRLGAEQVLWVGIDDFAVDTTPEDPNKAGRLSVSVRVLNARARGPEDVQLWPQAGDWRTVSVIKPMHALQTPEGREGLVRAMVAELADRVAKLFYDYEITPD